MCAAAVCATCMVAGHGHGVLELGLAWDMPRIRFGSAEKEHRRWVLPGKGWLPGVSLCFGGRPTWVTHTALPAGRCPGLCQHAAHSWS